MDPSQFCPLKRFGANRLLNAGAFKHIYTLDPQVAESLQSRGFAASLLPDPCPPFESIPSHAEALAKLDLPIDKTILLQYGTGTPRKGLHIVAEALIKARTLHHDYHLLVAGKQKQPPSATLDLLIKQGTCTLIDRYIEPEEESTLFAAADFILAPYTKHYGSANILAKSAAAERPLIASDYHLLGRIVKNKGLGHCFKNNSAGSLGRTLRALKGNPDAQSEYRDALKAYQKQSDVVAFNSAFMHSF
jgi:glycosyltransferase involved in cell wall biosynthesis